MATWTEGTEVIALYNFNGNPPEDLSFKRGEIMTIITSTSDPNWYKARKANGQAGVLPANYVEVHMTQPKLHNMSWFHGKISRDTATDILMKQAEDGCYLIRESSNYPGDYTLCVYFKKKVEHYHILYKNNKLTIDEESYFNDLHKLVQHYQNDNDGLVCALSLAMAKSSNKSNGAEAAQFFANSQWKINVNEVTFGELLGKGEYGEVYKGRYRDGDVAIKVIKDLQRVPLLLEEASVMTTLKHKNLVTLLGIVLGDTTYIIVELMAKGSLVDYLRTRGRLVITQADQVRFASDTCNGMAYLSQRDIVHRDLAARNVLLHEDGTAKVADFGLALPENSAHDNKTQGNSNKFPIKWTAPEAIKDSKKYTSKSDMWSYGILLWEIFSFGRVPYPRIPLAEVLSHIEKGYRMEPPDGCPPFIAKLMSRAWEYIPEKRPTFLAVQSELNRFMTANSLFGNNGALSQ